MPCEHDMYKKGESWTEEMGFSRDNINTALKNIAIKKTNKNKHSDLIKNAMIVYYIDRNRVTWYEINEKNIINQIKQLKIKG